MCSITDYGSEIFGFKEFDSIEKIHSRALRAFLGVGRTATIAGLRSEFGWLEPRSRRQINMVRMLHRLCNMEDSRLTKRILLWDLKLSESSNFSTWSKEVKEVLSRNNMNEVFPNNIFSV